MIGNVERRRRTPAPWIACLLAALAGCGGGGGGGGSKVKVGFQAAGSTLDEGQVGLVVLELRAPGPLAADVTVTVSDALTGTAGAGVDYSAAATEVVTFAAGSVDGDTRTVSISALADGLVEAAEETVRLVLSNPSGADLTKVATHDVAVRDAGSAIVQFTTDATVTPDEADATFDAVVELVLTGGSTLAVDVDVTVRDPGTGSATSGVDYVAFTPTALSFPAGTANGAQESVQITVLDDADAELDETVVLALDPPASAAAVALGGDALHVLSITEDEAFAPAFLYVSSSAGGPEAELASGAELDLGSQPSGGGPTDGVQVTLSNLGTEALHLSQLNLSGDFGDFAIELVDAAEGMEAAGLPGIAAFPFEPGGEDLLQGVRLRYDALQAAELAQQARVVLHGVPLPGAGPVALELERVEPPFAPDAVVRVDGVDRSPADVLGDLTLWRGAIVGDPASEVFLGLAASGSSGFVRTGAGASYELVSERDRAGAAPQSRLVPSEILAAQADPVPFACAEMAPLGGMPAGAGDGAPESLPVGLSLAECRLAVETDYQLHQKLGSVPATTAYVTQLVAAIAEQYREDVQTDLVIAYLGIHSSADDPWSSQDGGGTPGDLLDEFQAAWNASGWPVSADLAHFISGANIGGGVAYVGVLCNQFYGYGVSGSINGNINWASWTGQPGSNTWDFVVVAHELGHNFGSTHTHNYCPPLDHCASNCDGFQACSQGTLMSYCHLCSGGMNNIRPEFHPHVANVLRASVASSCIGGTTLDHGTSVRFQLRFEPTTGAGAKAATLGFTHDATNVASPFQVDLAGQAQ
jgi:hypothetical protein